MTFQQLPQPNSASQTHRSLQGALTLPAFVQAGVYLVFGLITVFWQQPTAATDAVLLGLFMLALGASTALTGARLKPYDPQLTQSLNSIAMLLAGAAALTLVLGTSIFWMSIIVSVALGLASILKIFCGVRAKRSLPFIAKDWQLEGIIMTCASVGLLMMSSIGSKAVLGTAGGGAIIAGVFLLIGALSIASEAKKLERD